MLSGCTGNENKDNLPGEGASISVTDFKGRDLHFQQPVSRVACLIESGLSGLYMLQVSDQLVAVPEDVYRSHLYPFYSRLDERIKEKNLPSPGNWEFISIEQLVGLQPDLVIAWASQQEAIKSIERLGIPVYAVMLDSFADVYKEMIDFGKLFGCQERAGSLVSSSQSNLERLRKMYSAGQPKKAYFMWAQGINETSGKKSTVNELLEAAGLVNACDLDPEHATVSVEKIIDWDPDIIVMWHNEKLDPEDILQDPLLEGIKAVRTGEVYELPEPFSCDFWTLKMQYAVSLVAQWAYPEITRKDSLSMSREGLFEFLYAKPIRTDE